MSANDKLKVDKFDVPFRAFCDTHLELFGSGKLIFEGKYNILEYTDKVLRIKNVKKIFIIIGEELELCALEADKFALVGKISKIEID